MLQTIFTVAVLHMFGPWEMAAIAMVSLLIFGNRLPSVMRSLGKSVTEFKKGMHSIEDDIEEGANPDSKKPEAVKDV